MGDFEIVLDDYLVISTREPIKLTRNKIDVEFGLEDSITTEETQSDYT